MLWPEEAMLHLEEALIWWGVITFLRGSSCLVEENYLASLLLGFQDVRTKLDVD